VAALRRCPRQVLTAEVRRCGSDRRHGRRRDQWRRRRRRRCGLLDARIIHDSAAKITVGEAKEIELVIGKAYGPQVIMQIIPLIDPNKKPAELQ
jgi:hypothetical protein